MKPIKVTQKEINDATRPNVYKNKKKYTRKKKHTDGNESQKLALFYLGIKLQK